MYKVKLWKIKSNHDGLRTDIIEGECEGLPKLAEDFRMFSKPLSLIDGFRTLRTTQVIKVIWDDDDIESRQACLFKTNNSTYLLFIKDEE